MYSPTVWPRDPIRATRAACATLLVALAGGANSMATVAAFTHDYQAWFRLWLPLDAATPSRDTYLRLVSWTPKRPCRRPCDCRGTGLPSLWELILDGQTTRRSGNRAAGRHCAFLVREGLIPTGSRARQRTTRARPSSACSTA